MREYCLLEWMRTFSNMQPMKKHSWQFDLIPMQERDTQMWFVKNVIQLQKWNEVKEVAHFGTKWSWLHYVCLINSTNMFLKKVIQYLLVWPLKPPKLWTNSWTLCGQLESQPVINSSFTVTKSHLTLFHLNQIFFAIKCAHLIPVSLTEYDSTSEFLPNILNIKSSAKNVPNIKYWAKLHIFSISQHTQIYLSL